MKKRFLERLLGRKEARKGFLGRFTTDPRLKLQVLEGFPALLARKPWNFQDRGRKSRTASVSSRTSPRPSGKMPVD